ncbi:MAG TPA: carbon monoxide dehydrogenase subunit G [Nocardioidaceae bacterium]|nr:carbon monoxide dehydrogenase subunit G [Nocardioidaceae bacterium]
MKVSGTSVLQAPRQEVWRALNDPAVLVQAIPGCRQLEALGEDAYKMTVAAGVGAIKGVYDGEVRLTDHEEPVSFRMHAQGAGAPGTIGAEVLVMLDEGPDGGTSLSYDADAVVGGTIGGVGQRMLTGVSKKMADEFFGNIDSLLAGLPTAAAQAAPAAAPGAAAAAPTPIGPAAPTAGQVFTAPARAAGGAQPGFVTGVVLGAASALAGVLVGAWVAGRRRG